MTGSSKWISDSLVETGKGMLKIYKGEIDIGEKE